MRALGSFQLASTANRVIQATKANAGNPWMQKGIPGLASHRRDQATISDRGRTLNAIQELNKQKTTLKDNRRALIADTLEQGKSLDEIEGQLDSYDEQLQTLEQQISDLTARLSEPETTEKKEKKSPETEEEAQKQQMGDLAELSAGWDRVGELDSLRTRLDGDCAVLESEIELDKFYAAQSGNRYRSTGKEELLSTLRSRSSQLSRQIGKELGEITRPDDETDPSFKTLTDLTKPSPESDRAEPDASDDQEA